MVRGNETFLDEWQKARESTGEINEVIRLVKQRFKMTRGRKHLEYKLSITGKQRRTLKNGEIKDEVAVENALLYPAGLRKECLIVRGGSARKVRFISNAIALTGRAKGQVETDLLGIDEEGSPVCGEVKRDDINGKKPANNPWYAVVECAEQVGFLRADRKHFLYDLKKKLNKIKDTDDERQITGWVRSPKFSGTWGMVIAPACYWEMKEYKEANRLIDKLKEAKTQLRICCVTYDRNNPKVLNLKAGYPPGRLRKLDNI